MTRKKNYNGRGYTTRTKKKIIMEEKREKTCINKAIVEMETKQRSPHAVFVGHCSIDCSSNGGEGFRACG